MRRFCNYSVWIVKDRTQKDEHDQEYLLRARRHCTNYRRPIRHALASIQRKLRAHSCGWPITMHLHQKREGREPDSRQLLLMRPFSSRMGTWYHYQPRNNHHHQVPNNLASNGIHSKLMNIQVRKLKNVRSSKETCIPIGWALPRDLVAMVDLDFLTFFNLEWIPLIPGGSEQAILPFRDSRRREEVLYSFSSTTCSVGIFLVN